MHQETSSNSANTTTLRVSGKNCICVHKYYITGHVCRFNYSFSNETINSLCDILTGMMIRTDTQKQLPRLVWKVHLCSHVVNYMHICAKFVSYIYVC